MYQSYRAFSAAQAGRTHASHLALMDCRPMALQCCTCVVDLGSGQTWTGPGTSGIREDVVANHGHMWTRVEQIQAESTRI